MARLVTPGSIANAYPVVRSASCVVAASNSPARVQAQADYICPGTADDITLALAYASGKVVVWGEGAYHFTNMLTLPQYSTTIFNNVTIVGDSGAYCIGLSSDVTLLGRILEYNANGVASALFYETAQTNIDIACSIDKFTAIASRAIYLVNGSNIKIRGGLTTVDPTGSIISSAGMPSNLLIENINASITSTLTHVIIALSDTTGNQPHDITVRNIFFDGANIQQVSDVCPFNIVCGHGKPWGKRLTLENINVINRDGDPLNIMHWDGVTARHLHATGSSSTTGVAGAGWQFNSVRNFEFDDVTHNGDAATGVHFDTFWGSNRFVKIKSSTFIDGGKSSPYPALQIGRGAMDTLASHYVNACILNDVDVGYTDYTAAARETTANDVKLMPDAPAQGDWVMFGLNDPPGAPVALTLLQNTAGAGTYTLVPEYRADDGTWKSLPGIFEVEGEAVNTFNHAGAGWWTYIWDLPNDFNTVYSETVNAITYTCLWVRFRISAFTNMTTQPLGSQVYLMCGNEDFDIDFVDAHQETGTTQTYGIEVAGISNRIKIGNNCRLIGNQTSPVNVVARALLGTSLYQTALGFSAGIQVRSVEMTLSNTAEDFVVFKAAQPSVIVGYEVLWTAAAGDTNTCTIRVGDVTPWESAPYAGVANTTYYDSYVTAGSELLNQVTYLRTADLTQCLIPTDQTITVGHTQKTGNGKVIITLFILEGCK